MSTKKTKFRYQCHLRVSFAITIALTPLVLIATFFALTRIEANTSKINNHIVAKTHRLQNLKLDLLNVQQDLEKIQNNTLLKSPQTAYIDVRAVAVEVRRISNYLLLESDDNGVDGRLLVNSLKVFDNAQQQFENLRQSDTGQFWPDIQWWLNAPAASTSLTDYQMQPITPLLKQQFKDVLTAQKQVSLAVDYVTTFGKRVDEELMQLGIQEQVQLEQLKNTFSLSRWGIFILSVTLLLIVFLNLHYMSASILVGANFLQRSITERTAALERSKQSLITVLQQERRSRESLLETQSQLQRANSALEHSLRELKKTQMAMAQQEKLASIGHLAAGVAHEINNPLGFILSNINRMHEYITDLSEVVTVAEKQLASGAHASLSNFHIYFRQLLEDKDVDFIKSDLPSLVNDCVEGGARVKDIIQSLKDFSRRDHNDDEFQLTSLHIIITKTLNLLRSEIKYDVDLKVDCDPDLCLEVLPGPLSQVLSNILINATHAIRLTERRGFIQVVAFRRKYQVIIKITDNGCGIHPNHQKSVFDPFFTTKKAGEGTGLGMNIAYDIIVNRHGGQLSVKSELGVGTEFFIELPMNPNHNRQSAPDAASSLTIEGV